MLPTGIDWLIFVGGILFTIALIPQAIRTVRRGRANDFSVPFILLIIVASILTLAYWLVREEPWIVYFGFVGNIMVWGLVLWYRVFPRPGTTSPKTS